MGEGGGGLRQPRLADEALVHIPESGFWDVDCGYDERPLGKVVGMIGLLVIAAVILAVVGFFQLLSGNIGLAIVLFVIACAVGPGGWAIYK